MDSVKTLIISVQTWEQSQARMLAILEDPNSSFEGARFNFPSGEELLHVLTPNRWSLLKAMAGQGPMSIRHAARLAGRDIKGAHADVTAMLFAGLLERDGDLVVFPYDEARVEMSIMSGTATSRPQAADAPTRRRGRPRKSRPEAA